MNRQTPTHVAAVPYRVCDGGAEILLVTSRQTARWIVPKGHIEPGETLRATAATEAFEEAGVRGAVAPDPLGRYCHGPGAPAVEAYLLRVECVLSVWPEGHERSRRWVPASEAGDCTDVPALAPLLRRADRAIRRLGPAGRPPLTSASAP